jgi:hypothetical protein
VTETSEYEALALDLDAPGHGLRRWECRRHWVAQGTSKTNVIWKKKDDVTEQHI